MKDADKTREQLYRELAGIRQQLAAKEAEYRQVEQALRWSEITIRALLDAPQQSVFVLDLNSTILEINEIAAHRYGKRAEDLIGTNVFDLMPSELVHSRKAYYLQAIETGKLVQFEDYRAGMWFQNQIFPIIDDQNTVTRLVIFAHDISERKQAEQALRESEARYKELFEHVPVALLEEDFSAVKAHMDRLRAGGVTDFRAYFEENAAAVKHCASLVKIVAVNQATLNLQQVESQQDAETDFSTTFEDDTYAIFRDELVALASGASHLTGESRIKTFAGQDRAIRLALQVAPGHQEDWSRVYIVVTDITERKQVELERQKLAHDLGERVKELDCLYGIARLVEQPAITLDEIFQQAVDLIPPAWQYPEITCACIKWGEKTFKTDGFCQSPWKLSSEIVVRDQPMGTVDVYYLEEKPPDAEGPFLKEERRLLDTIADQVGRIVDRIQAEVALQDSEERYRRLSELASDYAYSYDVTPDGQFLLEWITEDSFRRITGYTTDDFDNTISLYHPDYLPVHQQDMADLLNGQRTERDYRIITKSGEERWIHMTRHPVWDDDEKRVVHFYGVANDVTDRKRMEAELRESESQHRRVAEMVSDFAYSYRVDPDGTLAHEWVTEAAFKRITGYSSEEIGATLELFHPDDREAIREDVQRVLAGEGGRGEYRIITKAGELRWVQVHRQPIWDQNREQVVGYYGATRDITQRKQAEQQRLELALERERVQIMGNFITQASHEFRTPLTIINTSAHLAQRLADPAERQRQVTRIGEQVNHITKLVEDLITLSGLDSTRTLETTEIDLRSVIYTVHDLMHPGHHDKNLNVVIELSPDIPKIQGHFDYLRQAVERIWSNAVRHTPDGGTITVRMDRLDHDSIQIAIADTGCGIHPEDLPRVFERFFRTDRAGTTRGFGLGLPIAKAVVELHRGTIEVQSQLDQGTTFCLTLPVENGLSG